MKILRKEGDNIQLLCFPEEEVEKGDYLLITDKIKERSLIVQIIDIQYANIPGILEDLLRDGISEGSLTGDVSPIPQVGKCAVGQVGPLSD